MLVTTSVDRILNVHRHEDTPGRAQQRAIDREEKGDRAGIRRSRACA